MKDDGKKEDLSSRSVLKDILKIFALWSMAAILRNAFMGKRAGKGGRFSKRAFIAASAAGLVLLGLALYAIFGKWTSSGGTDRSGAEHRQGAVRGYRQETSPQESGPKETRGPGQTREGSGEAAEEKRPATEGKGPGAVGQATEKSPPPGGPFPEESASGAQEGAHRAAAAGSEGGEEKELADLKKQVDQLNREVDKLKERMPLPGATEQAGNLGRKTEERQFGRVQHEMSELRQEVSQLEVKETSAGTTVILRDFLFEFGKSNLLPGVERNIELLAKFLRRHPSREIYVEGFTDSTGPRGYNLELSRKRAEAVKSALASKGVDPDRIAARGYGEAYPVATNQTRAGRQLNRRVEVTLLNHGGKN